jgi:hypothetical protein
MPALLVKDPLVLWGVVVLATFYFSGRSLMTRILPEPPPFSLCIAGGAVIMSLVSLFLGSIGLYRSWLLVGITVVVGVICLFDFVLSRKREKPGFQVSYGPGIAEVITITLVGLIVIVTALNPTLFYDAVSYHLALPRQYLMSGSTDPFPWHPYSYFPSNAEMAFGLGLAGGGAIASQIISCGITISGLLMIRDTAIRFVSPAAGGVAFKVALCTLTFMLSGVMVTVDPFVLFLCIAGLFCVCGAGEAALKNDEAALRGWLLCWAIVAGGAAGVKYTAWITGLGLQWLLLARICLKARPYGPRLLALGSIISLLVLLPWPLRNFIACANPVMPVPVPGVFDGLAAPAWEAMKRDAHYITWSVSSLPRIVASPWNMVFSDWNTLAVEFGAARFVGPLLWMGAPLLLAFPGRPRVPATITVYAIAATLISLLSFRMTRFAYPGLGAMVILAGAGLYAFFKKAEEKKPARVAGALIIASIIVLSAAIYMKASYNLTAGYRWLLQKGDLAAYMDERAGINRFETGSIPLQLRANELLPADAFVLFAGETRFVYFDRKVAAPSFLSSNPLLLFLSRGTPEQTAQALAEAGFTHVLVSIPELERLEKKNHLLGLTPRLKHKVRKFSRGPFCRPLLEDERAGAVVCELARD